MDDYFDLGAFTLDQLVEARFGPWTTSIHDYKTDRIKLVLAEAGFEPRCRGIDVRTPTWHHQNGRGLAEVWHRDGINARSDPWIAVWSNVLPTRLRRPTNVRDVLTPEPGHLIVFNNDTWEHAAPHVPPQYSRTFLRCYCQRVRHA